jgi:hypothetical protein
MALCLSSGIDRRTTKRNLTPEITEHYTIATVRWIPVDIHCHAVQGSQVTHLTRLRVHNAISTAGCPSCMVAISRCVRILKNTSICPCATLQSRTCARRYDAQEGLGTQHLSVTETCKCTVLIGRNCRRIARIARQGIVAVHALRHHAQCGTTLVAEAIEARKGIAFTLRWAVPGVV